MQLFGPLPTMFTKEFKLGKIHNTDFEITWGWCVIGLLFLTTFSTPESYDRYLMILDTVFPFTVTPVFPESTPGMILFAAALIIGVYGSVVLHEFGHGFAAEHHGISVESIRLWIAGGVARISTIPPHPEKELMIAVAGPAVTAILIPIYLAISLVFFMLDFGVLYWLFLLLGLFNTAMLLLNLTPALPLDGGRILRSFLTRRFEYEKSTRIATRITIVIGVLVAVGSAFVISVGYVILAVIVAFLAFGEMARIKHQYDTDAVVRDEQEFLIYDRDVRIDLGIPDETRDVIAEYVVEHGGNITTSESGADYRIVDESLLPYYRRELGSEESPTLLTVETFFEYCELHGSTVTHDPGVVKAATAELPVVIDEPSLIVEFPDGKGRRAD